MHERIESITSFSLVVISSRSWERRATSIIQSEAKEMRVHPYVIVFIVIDQFILIMLMIDQRQWRRKTISLSVVWSGVIIGDDQSEKSIQIVLSVSFLRTIAPGGNSIKSVRFVYLGTFNPFTFALLKHVGQIQKNLIIFLSLNLHWERQVKFIVNL